MKLDEAFAPGEQYAFIFAQSRSEQLLRLTKQVEGLAARPTPDEALDTALSEIAYTIHVIRERIFHDAKHHNLTPSTLEDII